jgi:hypothetical protein
MITFAAGNKTAAGFSRSATRVARRFIGATAPQKAASTE